MSGPQQALLGQAQAAAAWAFRSVGAAGTGSNPTIALPAGHVANDLLVIVVAGGATGITSPSGWSVSSNSNNNPRLCVFYKIDSGSESAVTLSGGGSGAEGVMLAYSGINATPLDVNGTANTTLTTTSLTTTAANDLVISAFATNGLAATWVTIPANTNTRYNSGGLAGADALLVVDELKATAGATATRTASATGGNTNSMACSFKL